MGEGIENGGILTAYYDKSDLEDVKAGLKCKIYTYEYLFWVIAWTAGSFNAYPKSRVRISFQDFRKGWLDGFQFLICWESNYSNFYSFIEKWNQSKFLICYRHTQQFFVRYFGTYSIVK